MNFWTAWLDVAIYVFDFIIDLFPETSPTINAQIITFLDPLKSILAPVNYMFPVTTFFIVFGSVIAIETVIFTIKTTGWLIHVFTAGKFKGV